LGFFLYFLILYTIRKSLGIPVRRKEMEKEKTLQTTLRKVTKAISKIIPVVRELARDLGDEEWRKKAGINLNTH
jgi:hypothetical protein